MGNCNFKSDNDGTTSIIFIIVLRSLLIGLSKNNFVFHYVIGRGGFGKVWKVEKKKTK